MKEGTYFYLGGESSKEYGIMNASISSSGGLFQESFLATKKIEETATRGRTKNYFTGVTREPLEFDLEFVFETPYDKESIRKTARWLDKDHYREFYMENNPDRRLFVMFTDTSEIIHNGLGEGYLTLKIRCDDAYGFSQEFLTQEIDFSTNPSGGTNYTFMNQGDKEMMPEMWIKKIGIGDVSIENRANGQITQFVNLDDGEIVYVDNDNEDIESDISGIYRYDNFNDNYLTLEEGRNILNVKGKCRLQFRYRLILLQ